MRNIDFSSWEGIVTTLIGLSLVTLIGMGIRLLMMFTIQQRRERMNRQINERLRTLIAAYKTLGGSFTGTLTVDPTHLRHAGQQAEGAEPSSDRSRRIRDAVETALSDIILLGTEEQVRLAQHAARELVAGRAVHTHELVVSLRAFIREALDMTPFRRALKFPCRVRRGLPVLAAATRVSAAARAVADRAIWAWAAGWARVLPCQMTERRHIRAESAVVWDGEFRPSSRF